MDIMWVVNAPSDEKLFQEYLEGRAGAFELLVRRHTAELYQFVLRFTGDAAAAEDVIQESFVQVHASAERFDLRRKFKPWLFTIAANKARDHLRRRARRTELPLDALVDESADCGKRFAELLAADSAAVDEPLEMEERRRAVRAAVEAMPEKLREILILAYYHHFPYQDIAEVVGVPLGTVKSRLHAAVLAFRAGYEARTTGWSSSDRNRRHKRE